MKAKKVVRGQLVPDPFHVTFALELMDRLMFGVAPGTTVRSKLASIARKNYNITLSAIHTALIDFNEIFSYEIISRVIRHVGERTFSFDKIILFDGLPRYHMELCNI